MKTTMYWLLNLAAVAALFLLGCDSRYDCSSGNLQFNLPIQVFGLKDTMNIGDTLRVRLDIPDRLVERNLGVEYDFIDYNFKLISFIGKIDTTPIGTDSKGTFNWEIIEGDATYVGGVFLMFPVYKNNTYSYEVLIKPKKKGLFVFGLQSDAWRLNPLKKLDGPCSGNVVYVYARVTNVTDTNYEFLQFSPDSYYLKESRQEFDDAAGFCFFVR
jgi:hypothetical protein